jgi:hypothetical protein
MFFILSLKQTKMEASMTESIQQAVRPGKCVDVYYPDPETAKKQCFRTSQNTRFVQQFANLSGGSSVLTIPPNNGVQDIVLVFELADMSSGAANGLGLNRGWGYSAIKQVSFRYGGSSQYFVSGQQLLQNALRKAPNGSARDDLLALGGSALTAASLAAGPNFAYVWLSLPHTTPSAEGKLPPLPSDLLTQQIQVTVELYPISSIFSIASGSTGTVPTSLASAEFQVQQVLLENQGDALARRVDMTTNALSYPIEFVQQEVQIPISVGSAPDVSTKTVVLTGFRSGEVKNIQAWITRDADLSGAVKNPFRWIAPTDIQLSYAGEIYARFDAGSSQLWNLVNGRLTPGANDLTLADNGAGSGSGAITITTASLDQWVELPFGQSYDPVTAHSMYMSGKPITNGIVNLQFTMPLTYPGTTTPLDAGSYTLHVSYVYNGVLMFSQGTCDYVF